MIAFIDTLFLSPLLFPKRPYHHLVKDDKLQVDELNNPVNDSMKARDLLNDEVCEWNRLSANRQELYFGISEAVTINGLLDPIERATAKQKVISDICDYFREKLGLELKVFAANAERKNLRYSVLHADTADEKYNLLRSLILGHSCPSIVYVSRTRRTRELADHLVKDGARQAGWGEDIPLLQLRLDRQTRKSGRSEGHEPG